MASRTFAVLVAACFSILSQPAHALFLSGNVTQSSTLSAAAHTRTLESGTQRAKYVGTWRCDTAVVSSNMPQLIPVGQRIECLLTFKIVSNNLMVNWQQAGWDPANCSVVSFTPNVSTIVHRHADPAHPGWETFSQDQLRMTSSNTVESTSYVRELNNGRTVGEYRTVSQLSRI